MNFFKDVVTDMDKVQQEFLGPDYAYYKKIRNPSELGVSGSGNLGALEKDIASIIDYVEVLVSGTGPGNAPGKPLGDKFILKTGGQCKDYKTNKLVTRSMYINNVPTKKLPIVSNLTGMSFPDFRGIVPGIMEDMYAINPLKMFSAFMEGNEPLCAEVNLPTRDANDHESTQSAYIPITELEDMQSDGIIPGDVVSSEMRNALNKQTNSSTETFMNMCDVMNGVNSIKNKMKSQSNNWQQTVFYSAFSLLLLYICMKLMRRK